MAIVKRKRKKGLVYRVMFRNPYSGQVVLDSTHESLRDAKRRDNEIKELLEFEPETLQPLANFDEAVDPDDPTFAQLALAHLRRTDITEITRKQDVYHIKHILPVLGNLSVSQLTKEHFKRLESYLRDIRGNKQNTIHRRISVARAVLNWAERVRLIKESPIPHYRCERGQDLKLRPPTPGEIRKIISVAPEHLKRAIILSFYLGVRPGASELLKLEWANVDLERGTVLVYSAQKNKSAPWREVFIKPEILPLIEKWKQHDELFDIPWMITWKGKRISTIKNAWLSTLKRAGIKRRIRPYDLRHSFATEALAAGGDDKAVAETMGHADTTMIRRHYQHVLDSQKKAVTQNLPNITFDADPEGNILGQQSGSTKSPFSANFLLTRDKKIQ